MPPVPAWLSWSSGKDAAYALDAVRREGGFEVVGLLSVLTETFGRVSMHGVREALLDAQAEAVGVPLIKVRIPYPCPNPFYEQAMARALAQAEASGVRHVVFGDLFLEDVRQYREAQLARAGFEAVFPLWGRPTADLATEMIDRGVRSTICCLDPRKLPRRFAGRPFDRALLRELPGGVDPCGERGEFHTFASDGPAFSRPVPVTVGETVDRDGFAFTDLRPA